MSNRRGGFVEGKVYVGGLPEDATSEEVPILNSSIPLLKI